MVKKNEANIIRLFNADDKYRISSATRLQTFNKIHNPEFGK